MAYTPFSIRGLESAQGSIYTETNEAQILGFLDPGGTPEIILLHIA